MSEQPKHNDSLPRVSAEEGVIALVKKMQQQLDFLEKKIDILISQSQDRAFRQRPFSKPFRPFGHHRRPERGYGNAPEEKRFDRPRRFEKRHGQDSRGFESGSTEEHHFEKRHGQDSRGFGPKKKPFYYKRKGHG